ncbi:MAG TPA: hypothetical protein VMZ52_06555 [Bryobacteraceae bacterium]|nr:hypothetical protein [Bryobacteraceae bacterium]
MWKLLLFPVLTLAAFSADLTGTWAGQTINARGEVQDVSFQFKQNGNLLTGKMYNDNGDMPIADGAISGDAINFSVITGGEQKKAKYSGTIRGNEVKLQRESSQDAKDTGTKQEPAPPFIVKRMT